MKIISFRLSARAMRQVLIDHARKTKIFRKFSRPSPSEAKV